MPPIPFSGLRVLVVGLAREGVSATRFLLSRGARVSVTDSKPADRLQAQLTQLGDLPLDFYLGEHPAHLLHPDHCDLLVVSPGVPLDVPFLQQARQAGIPLSSEPRLLTCLCPAPIVGITGSSGKTTTTSLVGEMLDTSGHHTLVGGNIGRPLLEQVSSLKSDARVVLELSSFQLEYFHPQSGPPQLTPLLTGWSPPFGAVLNITPNHLDRHHTMQAYIQAKQALVQYMSPEANVVFGYDNPLSRAMAAQTAAQTAWFSLTEPVSPGAYLRGEELVLHSPNGEQSICHRRDLQLRGQHNVANVLAACAIASSAGANLEAMRQVATNFRGVQHRLEKIHQSARGVTFYNDSIATSPERLIAALESFAEPLILLAGGYDKDLPWNDAADLIHQRAKAVLLFGQAAELIETALQNSSLAAESPLKVQRCRQLEDAVERAKDLAQQGDVVLLSPGCASFDAYRDFAERGQHFSQLARTLAT